MRDQTQLRGKGALTTRELRIEFRSLPKLSILLSDSPFIECIRTGIDSGVFIYQKGDQVWGKGEPSPAIHIEDNAFVHTLDNAKKQHLWPRPEPLAVTLESNPKVIRPGEKASLSVEVSGGVPPYEFVSSEAGLSIGTSPSRSHVAAVSPAQSQEYTVEVTDKRGQVRSARTQVLVSVEGDPAPPLPPAAPVSPPPAPAAPAEFTAEGPLKVALAELFDKVRKARIQRIQTLVIQPIDAKAAFKIQTAAAQLKDADVTCKYDGSLDGDQIGQLKVRFTGSPEQAKNVRNFLESQLPAAKEQELRVDLTIEFADGHPADQSSTDALTASITKYGAGEAYVEAHAAPVEEQ